MPDLVGVRERVYIQRQGTQLLGAEGGLRYHAMSMATSQRQNEDRTGTHNSVSSWAKLLGAISIEVTMGLLSLPHSGGPECSVI